MRLLPVMSAIVGISLAGCGDCLSYAGPAFVVDVLDARTGAPIASGATLVARGPAGADSLIFPLDGETREKMTLFEGHLDGGFYTVEVRREGYANWSRSDVLLRPKGCGHVRAVFLTARLQPILQ